MERSNKTQIHLKYCTIQQEYIYKTFYVQVILTLSIEYPKSQTHIIILVKQVFKLRDKEIGKLPIPLIIRLGVNTDLST